MKPMKSGLWFTLMCVGSLALLAQPAFGQPRERGGPEDGPRAAREQPGPREQALEQQVRELQEQLKKMQGALAKSQGKPEGKPEGRPEAGPGPKEPDRRQAGGALEQKDGGGILERMRQRRLQELRGAQPKAPVGRPPGNPWADMRGRREGMGRPMPEARGPQGPRDGRREAAGRMAQGPRGLEQRGMGDRGMGPQAQGPWGRPMLGRAPFAGREQGPAMQRGQFAGREQGPAMQRGQSGPPMDRRQAFAPGQQFRGGGPQDVSTQVRQLLGEARQLLAKAEQLQDQINRPAQPGPMGDGQRRPMPPRR